MLDFLLHIDDYLGNLIRDFGPWIYGLLFLIIFAETGLVVTPFLPGDTLLFAAGMLSNASKSVPNPLNIYVVLLVLSVAPVVGDLCNYNLGRMLGRKLVAKKKILKPEHIEKTNKFFAKHGPKAIMLARWVPVVRTMAPFVAGIGEMPFKTFIRYSILGGLLWVWVCVGAGYFFGRIQVVRDNFEIAMLAMIAITVIPVIIEVVKARREAKHEALARSKAEAEPVS